MVRINSGRLTGKPVAKLAGPAASVHCKPRNQPRLIFATTSEPFPYSASDHGEILAIIIAMDVHGALCPGPRRRFVAAFQRVRFTDDGCFNRRSCCRSRFEISQGSPRARARLRTLSSSR
jgi:hypothetical protein